MKPLFCLAAALSIVWLVSAAPQPLSLMNTTVSDITESTTLNISEISTLENLSSSPPSSTASESDSRTEVGFSPTVTSTESAIAREETDFRTSQSDGTTVQNISSTTSKSTEVRKDLTESVTVPGTTFSKPTENNEGLSESEIPITRYVPPLDPMKHMLLMADVKGMPNLSNLVPKINSKPVSVTTSSPTSSDAESESDIVSTEVSSTSEKITESSSSTESSGTTESDSLSTNVILDLSTEKALEGISETSTAFKITEGIELSDSSEPREAESSEIKIESEETSDRILADESSEKVIAEASEVEEKDEKNFTEATVSDSVIKSTVLLKSDDLSTRTSFNEESSTDISSTQSIPSTTTVKETYTDRTLMPEVEEKLMLRENSDIELESEETAMTTKQNIELENETAAIFSSTEEAIRVDDSTSSDITFKNTESIKSETPFSENDQILKSTSSPVEAIELKNSDVSTSKDPTPVISTTSTTVVPETTFESSSTALPLESEKRNISLEDELEFRAVKIPLNASKVSYVDGKPEIVHDAATDDPNEKLENESEITTSNIFTTIADILFPSSTTETPVKLLEETADESSTLLTENESEVTDMRLSTEKGITESDSGTVLLNDAADMLKVQTVAAELSSVPSKETTTVLPTSESSIDDFQPVENFNAEIDTLNSDLDFAAENTENENLTETNSDAYTTNPSSSTIKEVVSTSSPVTFSTAPSSTEMQDSDHSTIETIEKVSEIRNDSHSDEKPSAYLSNIKNRYVSGNNTDMVAAVQFLHYHDKASSEQCFKLVDAHWNYATNLTEENKKKQLEQTLAYSLFHKAAWKNATSFAWKNFNDTLLRRWFKSLSVLGTAALPEDKLNEFNRLKAEMKNTYSTAKTCPYVPLREAKKGQILREKDCNLTLEPDLQRILTKSRDYDELVHVWKAWRNAAGKPIREKYLRFVELSNEASRMNGFSDTGDMWREAYESETFESDLEELWEQLRPLYENLHAYVRRRLVQQYGSDKIKEDGPIPAHLFGNMWAQSWVSLLDITQPFPGKPSVDVTPIMEAKNMSAHDMFKVSEEFFTSLGLKPMPEEFWKHSLIEKPKDREIICHASAWDFCNGKDYRIKQCTDITMEDLITVHHEMGHIQYFLQYARQPNVFREGANPGFHEAIGDVLALSVSTPKHLQSIGLLDEVADDPEGDLNFLLYTALDKVSFLPSGYLIDLWRWGLFSGDIKPEEMNTKWWELRLKYQGVCPPVKRTDTDFDPGAKFHVPGNVPYIRYFVSFVIQFQFHKVLCDAAGHTGPLYKCDIYRSKEAGQILSQVMELGSSEHWSEAMKIMTGGATNKMDAAPILEYFEPLLEFLKEQNKNETLGWRSSDPTICP